MRNSFTKIILISIFFSCFSISSIGQKNTNVSFITAEQDGDHINILYSIPNSAKKLYKVSVFASVNGNPRIMLNSVKGDIGDRVVGGKPRFKIIWDVFEDVKRLKNVKFFIKAELK